MFSMTSIAQGISPSSVTITTKPTKNNLTNQVIVRDSVTGKLNYINKSTFTNVIKKTGETSQIFEGDLRTRGAYESYAIGGSKTRILPQAIEFTSVGAVYKGLFGPRQVFTADREIFLQDKDGIVALVDDVVVKTGQPNQTIEGNIIVTNTANSSIRLSPTNLRFYDLVNGGSLNLQTTGDPMTTDENIQLPTGVTGTLALTSDIDNRTLQETLESGSTAIIIDDSSGSPKVISYGVYNPAMTKGGYAYSYMNSFSNGIIDDAHGVTSVTGSDLGINFQVRGADKMTISPTDIFVYQNTKIFGGLFGSVSSSTNQGAVIDSNTLDLPNFQFVTADYSAAIDGTFLRNGGHAGFGKKPADGYMIDVQGTVRTSGEITIPDGTSATSGVNRGQLYGLQYAYSLNATTVVLSTSTLNSTYPSAPINYEVLCPSITLGALIYKKTGASTWYSIPMTIAP